SQDAVPPSTPAPEYIGAARSPGQDDDDRSPQIRNARIALLRDQIREQQRQPRYHYAGPSARASGEARYLDQWRQTIEQTGTRHPRPPGHTAPPRPPGQADADRTPQPRTARTALRRDQTREQRRQPRYHSAGPSARASGEARSLDQWRQTIEQTGTRHYPRQ